MYCDLIVEPGRRAQAGRPVVGPKDAGDRLIRRALRGGHHAVATEALYFIVGCGVLQAVHRRGRRSPKLIGRLQDKRRAFAPMPAQGERDQADGILPPMAGQIARNKINAHERLKMFRAVPSTRGKDRAGRPLA